MVKRFEICKRKANVQESLTFYTSPHLNYRNEKKKESPFFLFLFFFSFPNRAIIVTSHCIMVHPFFLLFFSFFFFFFCFFLFFLFICTLVEFQTARIILFFTGKTESGTLRLERIYI